MEVDPKEFYRLRAIEHLAWHVCEASEERVAEKEIVVPLKEFRALSKKLPMEHPSHQALGRGEGKP